MIIRALGINFEITFLFVAFVAFISVVDTTANILLTLVASLIHECGHLAAMIIMGNKPLKVVFELGGINIINNSKTHLSLNQELKIALSGPFVNFIALVLSCNMFVVFNNEKILTFASINLILMVFNLLPIKNLDGGRALYYFLCKKYNVYVCSKVIFLLSIFFIIITFIWGLYILILTKYNFSLIIIAIFLTLSLVKDNEC